MQRTTGWACFSPQPRQTPHPGWSPLYPMSLPEWWGWAWLEGRIPTQVPSMQLVFNISLFIYKNEMSSQNCPFVHHKHKLELIWFLMCLPISRYQTRIKIQVWISNQSILGSRICCPIWNWMFSIPLSRRDTGKRMASILCVTHTKKERKKWKRN